MPLRIEKIIDRLRNVGGLYKILVVGKPGDEKLNRGPVTGGILVGGIEHLSLLGLVGRDKSLIHQSGDARGAIEDIGAGAAGLCLVDDLGDQILIGMT